MSRNNKIKNLIVMLIIVCIGIVALLMYSSDLSNSNEFLLTDNDTKVNEFVFKTKSHTVYLYEERSEKSNREVVTKEYVRTLSDDSEIVVINEDGSAYIVKGGGVLVDGVLIEVNENERSVYFVEDPEFSVSSIK